MICYTEAKLDINTRNNFELFLYLNCSVMLFQSKLFLIFPIFIQFFWEEKRPYIWFGSHQQVVITLPSIREIDLIAPSPQSQ